MSEYIDVPSVVWRRLRDRWERRREREMKRGGTRGVSAEYTSLPVSFAHRCPDEYFPPLVLSSFTSTSFALQHNTIAMINHRTTSQRGCSDSAYPVV